VLRRNTDLAVAARRPYPLRPIVHAHDRPRLASNSSGGLKTKSFMEKVPMTDEGFRTLDEELKRLKSVERPNVIAAISEARSHGDLSENAEYHAAKERQGWIEGRIAEIEDKISRAQVIDVSKLSGKQVKFGATVSVVDEDTEEEARYQIVGEHEADVRSGRISLTSPLSRAMIGKEVGDVVEVNTPGGVKAYEILKVEWI
jgi:transcription elongation factor GreA